MTLLPEEVEEELPRISVPEAVKAALPGVTYTGVSGSIAFDEQGDAVRDTAYIKTADTANNVWTLETVQTAS